MNTVVKVLLIIFLLTTMIGILNLVMNAIDFSIIDNTITWVFNIFAQTNGVLPVVKIEQDMLVILQVFSASITTLIVVFVIRKFTS